MRWSTSSYSVARGFCRLTRDMTGSCVYTGKRSEKHVNNTHTGLRCAILLASCTVLWGKAVTRGKQEETMR